jgi:hypothetical protein
VRIKIEIEATSCELADFVTRIRGALSRVSNVQSVEMLEATPDPRTLSLNDPRRFRPTGTIDDYGQREMVDQRTGRRGVMMDWCGWTPGAYVTPDGRIEFEHPSDNPLQGCSWT